MKRSNEDQEILNRFAALIRSKRADLNLTQMQLAEAVNCHLNAIGRIERAEADPSLVMVARIAKALNMSLEDVIPE